MAYCDACKKDHPAGTSCPLINAPAFVIWPVDWRQPGLSYVWPQRHFRRAQRRRNELTRAGWKYVFACKPPLRRLGRAFIQWPFPMEVLSPPPDYDHPEDRLENQQ